MRRSVGSVIGLVLVLAAVAWTPMAHASSIGGVGGFVAQLGARLDRPDAAPAVKVGVTFEATVVTAAKLTAFGLSGAKTGDRIRVSILAGNKLQVSLLSPASGAVQGTRPGALSPARSVSLSYGTNGKLSATR